MSTMKHACVSFVLLLVLSLNPACAAPAADGYAEQRARMVTRQLETRGIRDAATLAAMGSVPRHEFVPAARRAQAYSDGPLPIGYGQTISQPYIVAYMTELLRLKPGMRVLEIGTGSGYQAAVLGELLEEVYTLEIVHELALWGEENLRRAGYEHVRVKQGDGYFGWEEFAPFDAIVVTAAADHIPPPLIEQLRDGGRMVIPVGSPFRTQMLMLVTREGDDIRTESLLPVRFVPFTRDPE
jgi:protein-L-isoaspartate(D-aspartate) O-methyltransferase